MARPTVRESGRLSDVIVKKYTEIHVLFIETTTIRRMIYIPELIITRRTTYVSLNLFILR